MTNLQALIELHAIQSFRRLPRPYGPGFFANKQWLDSGLKSPNRRTSVRLAKLGRCYACDTDVLASGGTGDHIIATKHGGPHGAENYAPMCSPCNSRKGTRDLLHWWHGSGRRVADIPADVVCAYSRLMYRHLEARDELYDEAHADTVAAIRDYETALPEQAHVLAVRRAALKPLMEAA